MITIKRLSECPIRDAVDAWNKGFEDYYTKFVMTVDLFIGRMAAEDLSADISVVAYADGEPVGLIVNGIRSVGESRIAWNGGTSVAATFRRQGIGRSMLEESLRLYKQENADAAVLEAVSENTKAIRLYESLGYTVTDRLILLERNDRTKPVEADGAYRLRKGRPQEAAVLDFYRRDNAWQTHWQSCKEGEALFALDEKGEVAGYSLLRRRFDASAKHIGTTLLQCETVRGRQDRSGIIRSMLGAVFGEDGPAEIQQRAFNLSMTLDEEVISALRSFGFESASEQVMMKAKVIPNA